MFIAATFTNAVAVYLLHDVDADRVGQWSLAYSELEQEFFIYSLVVAAVFLLLTWIGRAALRLRDVTPNLKLALVLGIALILIQYPAEWTARKFSHGHSPDMFLLGYFLLSPVFCAAVILLDSHKHRLARRQLMSEQEIISR